MRPRVFKWLVSAVPALVYVAACTDTFIVDDPSFDLWCDDVLCAWDMDVGSIDKVPTWHEKDYGVELVDQPTQISQLADTEASCFRFDLIANVEASALAKVQVDFNDDGSIEESLPIPTTKWSSVEFLIPAPPRYDGVRFIVRKDGAGEAIVAQVGVSSDSACEGIDFEDQRCSADRDCESGVCANANTDPNDEEAWLADRFCSLCAKGGTCSEGEDCAEDAHCDGDRLCLEGQCRGCAALGSCAEGDACRDDAHCAFGSCRDGVCGGCSEDIDCGDDAACVFGFCSECQSDDDCVEDKLCAFENPHTPSRHTCQPRRGFDKREYGQLCSADAQCKDRRSCAALAEDLPTRCGTACEGEGEVCEEADQRCLEIATWLDRELNVLHGLVCGTQTDCGDFNADCGAF